MPFPVDEKWIRATEQELGLDLPYSYRNRLKQDNGGDLEAAGDIWILHPIFDQSDRTRVKRTCNHVLAETRSARSWAGFPDDAIAIAANGSGDLLLFLVDEASRTVFGSLVWLWDHDTRQIVPIADFAELAPLHVVN